jgi:hypothetical protein
MTTGDVPKAYVNKSTRVRPAGWKASVSFNKKRDTPLRVALLPDSKLSLVGFHLRSESHGIPPCIYQSANGSPHVSQPVQVQCRILAKTGCGKGRQFDGVPKYVEVAHIVIV